MLLSILLFIVLLAGRVTGTTIEWKVEDESPDDEGFVAFVFARIDGALWGTMCGDTFEKSEADAACRTAGFPNGAITFFPAPVDYSEFAPVVTNVVCPSTSSTTLTQCSYTPLSGGPCSSLAVVDCGEYTPAPGSSTAPATVFEMEFNPPTAYVKADFRSAFETTIVNFMASKGQTIQSSRIDYRDLREVVTTGEASDYIVSWNFIMGGEPSNSVLEELLVLYVWQIFPLSLNLTKFNDVPPPAPTAEGLNTTNWVFKLIDHIYDNEWAGMLIVQPGPDMPWGTICNDGWDDGGEQLEFNLFPGCRSAGWAAPAPGLRIMPTVGAEREAMSILMDEVRCRATDYYLNTCPFNYTAPNTPQHQINHDCSHVEDVFLDCFMNGPAPTPVPSMNPSYDNTEVVGWYAEVISADYGSNAQDLADAFQRSLTEFVSAPDARYLTIDVVYGTPLSVVHFRFTNATTQFEPAREQWDAYLMNTDNTTLRFVLHITRLWSNATYFHPPDVIPDGPFDVSLSDYDNHRGRILVYPNGGPNPIEGSVCSRAVFRSHEAEAFCRSLDINYDVAGAIPFFGGGTGPNYLSDVLCHEANMANFLNCSYVLHMDGSEVDGCGHNADVGIICASLSRPLAAANVSQTVTIYSVDLVVGWSVEDFYEACVDLIDITNTRFVFDALTSNADGSISFDFYFTDNTEVFDIARLDYEYWFDHIGNLGKSERLGIVSYTSRVDKPPTGNTLPPFKWYDQGSWEWRMDQGAGAENTGLLQMRPNATAQWGTVCRNGFSMQSALAACRTLGFNPSTAYAYTPTITRWGTGPIWLDSISCPDPTVDRYIANCSVDFAEWGALNGCTHDNDVYLDCSKAGTESTDTYFTAITLQSSYTTEAAFIAKWAHFFNATIDRVLVMATRDFGNYRYFDFSFVNNNNTQTLNPGSMGSFSFPASGASGESDNTPSEFEAHLAIQDQSPAAQGGFPAARAAVAAKLEGRGFEAQSSVAFPSGIPNEMAFPSGTSAAASSAFSIAELFAGYGNMDSVLLESVVSLLPAEVLYDSFGIYEMWPNTTTPSKDAGEGAYTYRLTSGKDGMNTVFGRVELQPGKDAMWGTVCSAGAQAPAAVQICQTLNSGVTTAQIIPHFKTGTNIIWASQASITAGALGYMMSSKTSKKNDCMHMSDMGLICGRGVVADPSTPISYLARITATRFGDNNAFAQCMSGVTGVPSVRFSVTNVADEGALLAVNFTFAAGGAADATLGDIDLMVQYTNEWALKDSCGVQSILYGAQIIPDEFPSFSFPDFSSGGSAETDATDPTTTPMKSGTTIPGPTLPGGSTSTTTTTKAPVPTMPGGSTSTTTTTKAPVPTMPGGSTSTTTTTMAPVPTMPGGSTTTTGPPPTMPGGSTSTTTTGAPPTMPGGSTSTTTTSTTTTTTTTVTTTTPTTTKAYTRVSVTSEANVPEGTIELAASNYSGTMQSCERNSDATLTCMIDFEYKADADRFVNDVAANRVSGAASAAEVTSPPAAKEEESGSKTGIIIGVIVGVAVLAAVVGGAIAYSRSKSSQARSYEMDDDFVQMNASLNNGQSSQAGIEIVDLI